jgi:hypothetical protein
VANEIELLTEEVEELTYQLKQLTSTVMDVTGAYNKAMGKQAQVTQQTTKLVDQFGREIESNTKATKESTRVKQDEFEQTRRLIRNKLRETDATTSLINEFGRGTSVSALLRGEFEKNSEVARALTVGFEGLVNATKTYANALYRGERGASVAAKAMSELTKPLTDFGAAVSAAMVALSLIPGIGIGVRLLGLAIAGTTAALTAVTKFNELAAEQADRLFKSFRELSKVGASTAGGMNDVFLTMQTLGMSMAEIEQFNQFVAEGAQKLSLLGVNAGEGARRFAQVAGTLYKSRLGEQLEMLGISAEEQRESALVYMNIQARTGQMQLKNTAQLIQESAKFAKELDLAAQLTGQTRKEQAAAREAALAEVRFRAALIDAERRGDVAEMQRLKAAEQMAAIARGFGDERGFRGILQIAAGRGALTTPEAVAAEMTYGVTRILQTPNQSQIEMAQRMGESVTVQQQQLAGIIRYSGDIQQLSTDFVKTADFQKRTALLLEEANKQGLRGPNALLKVLETEQGKRIAAGGDTKLMVTAGRAQQAAALTMDAVVARFNGAAQLNKSAAETFRDAVQTFTRQKVPGGVPGQGMVPPTAANTRGPGFAAGAGQATPTTQDYLTRLMQLESGGRNIETQVGGGTSSAFGLYQITKTTFDSLVANAPPGSPLRGKTFEDMKSDVELQKAAVTALTDSNVRMLARRGLSTSDAAKYMSHVLGYPTAARVLEANTNLAIDKVVAQRAMINNPAIFKDVKTVGDLRKKFSDITGGGGYRFGGIASGPKSGYMAVLHGTEAVIPMPNGQSIKVDMPDFADGIKRQMDVMSAQLHRLDDLVQIMRNQNAISSKILQVSQS